jgi:hypothetical protein
MHTRRRAPGGGVVGAQRAGLESLGRAAEMRRRRGLPSRSLNRDKVFNTLSEIANEK